VANGGVKLSLSMLSELTALPPSCPVPILAPDPFGAEYLILTSLLFPMDLL
jgi:hypothetical protein